MIRRTQLGGVLTVYFCLFASLGYPAAAKACGWDQDTVYLDARYMRDVLAVLMGRFPRNPDLYYEMRLERTKKALAQNPGLLNGYDDAGVASDRLGRPEDAILFMDKKKAQIDLLADADKTKKDALYRYLSNLGTFYYHRWLKQGASRKDLSDVKQAQKRLAEALRVNPKAHFGRERYQLLAMEWILAGKKELEQAALQTPEEVLKAKLIPSFIPGLIAATAYLQDQEEEAERKAPAAREGADRLTALKKQYSDAARGLAGLIALGSSWESVDVFHNLALVFRLLMDSTALSAVASLRAYELLDEGKQTLYPSPPKNLKAVIGFELQSFRFEGRDWSEIQDRLGKMTKQQYRQMKGKTFIEKQFHALRAEAETWSQARNAYMMTQLQAGKHPDTHANFWEGFAEPPLPMLVRAKADPKLNLLAGFDGEVPALPAGAADKR